MTLVTALVMVLKSKKKTKKNVAKVKKRAFHLRFSEEERQRLFIHTLGKCTAEQNAGSQAGLGQLHE